MNLSRFRRLAPLVVLLFCATASAHERPKPALSIPCRLHFAATNGRNRVEATRLIDLPFAPPPGTVLGGYDEPRTGLVKDAFVVERLEWSDHERRLDVYLHGTTGTGDIPLFLLKALGLRWNIPGIYCDAI